MKKANPSVFMLMLLSAVLILSCRPSGDENSQEDKSTASIEERIQNEKEQIASNLQNLRNDIDTQMNKVTVHLEEAKTDTKAELTGIQRDLQIQRRELDESIHEIQSSTEEKWDQVKEDANETLRDVRKEFRKLEEKVNAMFSDERS